MFYFKRESPAAIEWFKMADPVFQNWREVYKQILKDKKPPAFHKNILCNIVHHFLDCEKEIIVPINNYYDLDLRSQGLWHYDVPEHWTDMLNSWYTQEGRLIIENSVIENGIIHYRDKKFLTQEVIDDIRTKATISDTREAAT